MRRAVRVLWIVTITAIIGIIPWMITAMADDGYSVAGIVQMVAGVFTLGAVLLSIWLIAMHLDNLTSPRLQSPILRIILMVPIYSLNCWLSLMFPPISLYLDTFRKIYEAFVLNQFFVYLTTYLGGDPEKGDFTQIEMKLHKREGGRQQHIFPMCCLQTWSEDSFVGGCRTGINAYVFCRVVTSLVQIVLQPLGLYRQGDLSLASPFLWFTITNNLVSCWAIYCVVLFYLALERELRPINPLAKILCVKAVVFFSWWQSVVLVIVEDAGLLEDHSAWTQYDEGEIAIGIQDFFICIEMLFVALVHTWAFSYKEFRVAVKPGAGEDDDDERDTLFQRFLHMFDFRDIGQDVYQTTRNPTMPEIDRASLAPLLPDRASLEARLSQAHKGLRQTTDRLFPMTNKSDAGGRGIEGEGDSTSKSVEGEDSVLEGDLSKQVEDGDPAELLEAGDAVKELSPPVAASTDSVQGGDRGAE